MSPSSDANPAPTAISRLRDRAWKRFLRGPDPQLLDELYVPALGAAAKYDRCCAYFSSSVLAAAARGFAGFIERLLARTQRPTGPLIRFVVNEELAADDLQALMERQDTTALEELLLKRLKTPKDLLEKQRLGMLAWLVKEGWLEVRVGVMRQGGGIVHAKFGIVTDDHGDAVVFNGSGNETASGLRGNYEALEVSTSWGDPERHTEYVAEFDRLWRDRHADVHTVPLPEAVQKKLIRLAPDEAPIVEPGDALARQKAFMQLQFALEAPFMEGGGPACDATAFVELWPHQRRVVRETAEAWPDGRLLCDEVGMGKTIEAICVLRRLLAGRGVRRALLLVPKGLLKQWQAELREKGGLTVPRLEGLDKIVWPDGREERTEGLEGALDHDLLLMSRETARTENNRLLLMKAKRWDLVLLDEAHAARRRKQEEREYNPASLLLALLRELQLRQQTRSIMLLSATPMQTHPWEPWDLLATLGEGGIWLAEFKSVFRFYSAMNAVRDGRLTMPEAKWVARLIATDPLFPACPNEQIKNSDAAMVAQKLVFAAPGERESLSRWLRSGTPLSRRMHRNTRDTLRQYHRLGLLDRPPPNRIVDDARFDYKDPREREVYDAVTDYIDKRFGELEREKPGKGFVMTIYRRRAASSPLALERSLERRKQGLASVVKKHLADSYAEDEAFDVIDLDDLGDEIGADKVSAALPNDPKAALGEMSQIESLLESLRSLKGVDSKRDEFISRVKAARDDGRSVLVFTQYTDSMEYLRDPMVDLFGDCVGCYSGDGGAVWDGQTWAAVTKDQITTRLRSGELRVVVCTDAASEGLNLQAASALVNYDLPWNPSRVEQRIGRIDRIGQRFGQILITNLLLKDSVDDQVYRALRVRCGLFEHFVGPMQPVLARARLMLLGRATADAHELERMAKEQAADALAAEAYLSSEAMPEAIVPPAVDLLQFRDCVEGLDGIDGFSVAADAEGAVRVRRADGRVSCVLASNPGVLERRKEAVPLSLQSGVVRDILATLARPGERLPLVTGIAEIDGFRRVVMGWIGDGGAEPVERMADLASRIAGWDGLGPTPDQVVQAQSWARTKAQELAQRDAEQATSRAARAQVAQVAAATARLNAEIGRFLACLSGDTADLNATFYEQMGRASATAMRLRTCYERLHGYPDWDELSVEELRAWLATTADARRQIMITGTELDAALGDPRWAATQPHPNQVGC